MTSCSLPRQCLHSEQVEPLSSPPIGEVSEARSGLGRIWLFRFDGRQQVRDHFPIIDATDRGTEQGSYRGGESSIFVEVSEDSSANDDFSSGVAFAFLCLGLL